MAAKHYYGDHATGVVLLVNGFPRHFTGPTARLDAETAKREREVREAAQTEALCRCAERATRESPEH